MSALAPVWIVFILTLTDHVSPFPGETCDATGGYGHTTSLCEGETLKLKCDQSLEGSEFRYNDPENDSILPVEPRYQKWSKDNQTLMLEIPHVTTKMNNAEYWCSNKTSGQSTKPANVKRLRVVGNPLVAMGMECVSYHPFESMRCDWGCGSQHVIDAAKLFNFTLQWEMRKGIYMNRGGNCEDGVTRDGHFIQCACKFTRGNFFSKAFYKMTVRADSDCGACNFREEFSIRATHRNIAKLGPIDLDPDSVQAGEETVDLSWEDMSGDKSDYLGVIYDIKYFDQSSPTNVSKITRNVNKAVLRGLRPHTTYNISVSAKIEGGHYSSDERPITVTTLQQAPSAGPFVQMDSFQSIGETNKRSVTIYWKEIDPANRNGVISNYLVRVNATSGDCNSCNSTNCSTQGHSCRFELELDIEYEVEVAGVSDGGEKPGKWARPIKIPKQAEIMSAPCVEIVRSDVKGDTMSDVNLTVYVPGDAGTKYTLYTCTAKHGQCQDSPMTWTSSEGARSLSAGIPQGHDVYSVSAIFHNATSGLAAFQSIDTVCQDIARSPPTLNFPAEQPDRGIVIEWKRGRCSTGQPIIASFYSVAVREVNGEHFSHQRNVSSACGMDKMRVIVKDLKPYTNYSITVTSCTRSGHCNMSRPGEKRTKESLPGCPGNLSVTHLTSRTVHCAWQQPLAPNGEISNYKVSLTSEKHNQSNQTQDTSYQFHGLHGFTNYTLVVVAQNGAGLSEEYAVNHIFTPMREPSTPRVNQEPSPEDVNSVIVRWTVASPNGPLSYYSVSEGDNKAENVTTTFKEVSKQCHSDYQDGFNVSVVAVNVYMNGSSELVSDRGTVWIKCYHGINTALVTCLSVLAAVGIILVIFVQFMKFKGKYENEDFKIVFPPEEDISSKVPEAEDDYSSIPAKINGDTGIVEDDVFHGTDQEKKTVCFRIDSPDVATGADGCFNTPEKDNEDRQVSLETTDYVTGMPTEVIAPTESASEKAKSTDSGGASTVEPTVKPPSDKFGRSKNFLCTVQFDSDDNTCTIRFEPDKNGLELDSAVCPMVCEYDQGSRMCVKKQDPKDYVKWKTSDDINDDLKEAADLKNKTGSYTDSKGLGDSGVAEVRLDGGNHDSTPESSPKKPETTAGYVVLPVVLSI